MKYTARQLFEREKNAVCKVRTMSGTGSGYVYSRAAGIVITNAHVIRSQTKSAYQTCTLEFGSQTCSATVLAYGDDTSPTDFAVLRVASLPYNATECTLRSAPAVHGENIFIIGYPLGGSLTITQGIVNNPDYNVNGHSYILTDTTVNPGNSGGPMFDEEGYVLGTAVSKTVKEGITGQHHVLSVAQFEAFRARLGFDLLRGPYPSTPVYIGASYAPPSTPSYPQNPAFPPSGGNPYGGNPFGGMPFGGNPYGGNPFGGNPFGGAPFGGNPFGGNPFGGQFAPGSMVMTMGPNGMPMQMLVSGVVQYGAGQYAVLRTQTMPMATYYLYQIVNGTLMPVTDPNLSSYVISYCMQSGILV